MAKIITPKDFVQIEDSPLIFLAGPIQGAPNWHDKAMSYLFSKENNLYIASPKRIVGPNLSKYVVSGNKDFFPRQRAWERFYLDLASMNGSIMFWLPGEENHNCGKVYGAMTRLELGQWMTKYSFDMKTRFCIGSDGNFPELKTIKYDLSLDAPGKEIFSSLEEVCDEAISLTKIK